MESPEPRPTGRHIMLLASAGEDIAFWDWDADAESALFRSSPHVAEISAVRWTANDRVLGSGSKDGTVVLTEENGNLFDTLSVSRSPDAPVAVLGLTWSPGSRYLAVAGSDALVRIFDLQKRVQALVLRGHRTAVLGVAWAPSEVHVASSSQAGEIIVHRVQGSVAAVVRVQHPVPDPTPTSTWSTTQGPVGIVALQWSPDLSSRLATAADDGSVATWDLNPAAPTAAPLHVFNEHSAACTGLQWSPVNHHLVLEQC